MAKPELGTKRLCASCGAKFYDLNKDPIHCPKCGTVYEVAPIVTRGGRPDAAAAARPAEEETVAAETPEVETVSLEEADAEASSGTAKKPAAGDVDIGDDDVEIDESLDDDDDNTFIEEQEEEDADVTDIIGGDIENEEEG